MPPSWQHGVLNSTPEYHTYSIALNEAQPLGITGSPSTTSNTATGLALDGFGFGASQGSGKVELWSDSSGTIKVAQPVTAWADGQIIIDFDAGALADSTAYFVVTNGNGDVSGAVLVSVGFGAYNPQPTIGFDHFWTFQNTIADTGTIANRPVGNQVAGSPTFTNANFIRSGTHSYRFDAGNDRSEIADSPYTNDTNQHEARNVGGWVYLSDYQEIPSCIYEEGGGVNNFYFIVGFGNILLANVADSSKGFKIQAVSDNPLLPGRWYHIMLSFQGTAYDNEFRLYVDGVLQTVTNGNPVGNLAMSTHVGDFCFGDPDGNLDTGGTDIAYNASTVMDLSHWGTASAIGGGAPILPLNIRQALFENGAPQAISIASDTVANMQADIASYDGTTHNELHGMTYQIGEPDDANDMTLTITDQVFPDSVSCHIRWLGSGTLTIRNAGTSNAEIASTPSGGTVVLATVATLTVTTVDLTTGQPVPDTTVLVETGTGGPIPDDTELVRGLTDVNGRISATIDYTADQPIVGRARKHRTSTGPRYKTADIVGTIASTGVLLTVFMLPDE